MVCADGIQTSAITERSLEIRQQLMSWMMSKCCDSMTFTEFFKFRKYSSPEVVFIYDFIYSFYVLKLINHFKTVSTYKNDLFATTQLPKK